MNSVIMSLCLVAASEKDETHRIDHMESSSISRDYQNKSCLVGISFLVLLHLFVLPLVSWIRTTVLYSKLEQSVEKSNSVDFERIFRKASVELVQSHRQQTKFRYLLLSTYSAIVLWENLD
jgi:hypothetical protein